ncbi:MAG: 8-oxo-dGTP diphosphatase MutT [Candidatus Rokuibacteriota bacterium]|nr:MAG: 8-oxo-dGTP diphosphatase MutT [Candidatus Rokubacteria bacterium]
MVHPAEAEVSLLPDERLLRNRRLSQRPRSPVPLVIEVAAALIRDAAGRYLITQRRRGSHLEGLWEFPGGKQEAGESPETCLKRELAEELSASFAVGEKFTTIRWEYPDRTVILHFFRCRLESGTIEPRESQTMAWVAAERLDEFDFPPADRELVARLRAGRA